MEKYSILLGYFDKQLAFVSKIYKETIAVDLTVYEKRFLFAMRVQHFYTAIEDLLKQIAKSFENHIDSMSNFHKELLIRMNTEIPQIRPAVLSNDSFMLLDKLRAFRHFIRHAYDCELHESELSLIQKRIKSEHPTLEKDLHDFRSYIWSLSKD